MSALPLCGCSTEGGSLDSAPNAPDAGIGGGRPCTFDYAKYQPLPPTLTLKTDILPIIARSCALSTSCHRNGTPYHMSLGPGIVDGVVVATDAVLADISLSLSMPSVEVPDWLRLRKGDPEHSYLMRKLDGTERCGDLRCVVVAGSPEPCGERMPGGDSSLPLEREELEKVRAWIAQGAN